MSVHLMITGQKPYKNNLNHILYDHSIKTILPASTNFLTSRTILLKALVSIVFYTFWDGYLQTINCVEIFLNLQNLKSLVVCYLTCTRPQVSTHSKAVIL